MSVMSRVSTPVPPIVDRAAADMAWLISQRKAEREASENALVLLRANGDKEGAAIHEDLVALHSEMIYQLEQGIAAYVAILKASGGYHREQGANQ